MFLPITALCFIKSYLIQTALLFAAFIFSTAFLVKGILRYLWVYVVSAAVWARRRKVC
jgi:hypothetical protein